MSQDRFYRGDGKKRAHVAAELPEVNQKTLREPAGYLASAELTAAVDVALTLGMPLLLTGEPGSGKSGLAASLAHELGLGEVKRFVVKSDTQARDLFYRFDTVGRFHAANSKDVDADPRRFITFEALGQAILHAQPPSYAEGLGLSAAVGERSAEPRRSVVLIDEIDKAPRDVPNDILVELEDMTFSVAELASRETPKVTIDLNDASGEPDNRFRPIVIITSNAEKSLPDPFLRRCVYHHLSLPPFDGEARDGEPTVERIVAQRLGQRFASQAPGLARDALALFRRLRDEDSALSRKPSLAEFLNWLDYLLTAQASAGQHVDGFAGLAQERLLATVKQLLVKNVDDHRLLPGLLQPAAEPATG